MRGVLKIRALVVTASLIAVQLLSATTHALIVDTSLPREPTKTPLKISAYSMGVTSEASDDKTTIYREVVRYIEIYNDSSQPVDPREYTLQVTDTKGNITASVTFNGYEPERKGYIVPGGFLTVSFNGSADVQFDFDASEVGYGAEKPELNRELQLYRGGVGVYAKEVKLGITTLSKEGSSRAPDVSIPQTRLIFTTVTAEEQAAETQRVYDTKLVVPRAEFPLQPIEVYANPKNCGLSERGDMACQEYIKFFNPLEGDRIEFHGVRLRVGSLGQTSTASNTTLLSGSINPGEYKIFVLPITNSGGLVWLEDEYGVMPFENTIVEYPDASATSKKGSSWAVIDGEWQWATPNPSGANIQIPIDEPVVKLGALKPCRSDQYRNPETNRCKLIASTASSLKPCAANQVRNPETNRCRLISSAAASSSLKPCASNQYRNPETNRCRLITSAASVLKPCAANQERNPETNRCRAILGATMPSADFPVEDAPESGDQSLGWIAFAGVGAMALGYAGWEWRYEIAGIFRRLKGLVTKA